MDYLSCFSGIGGLEVDGLLPTLCEIDPVCREVLRRQFPSAKIFEDINRIEDMRFELICGGWPCQDISVAGTKRGLSGPNSRLFYRFMKLAQQGGAATVVAENVSNLLKLDNGAVFREVLFHTREAGFPHICWRTLNARSFGLPHHRNRVFIIASKSQDAAFSIFRTLPVQQRRSDPPSTAGFYWTAGTHSINYSLGYTPTLKVGSSINIPSPPALHYNGVVRQISAVEALRLQGFSESAFEGIKPSHIYRMAGNAVARPVGSFVLKGVVDAEGNGEKTVKFADVQRNLFSDEIDNNFSGAGYFDGEVHNPILDDEPPGCSDLDDFIDYSSDDRLSARAAGGLLSRLEKSGMPCPDSLFDDLKSLSSVKMGQVC